MIDEQYYQTHYLLARKWGCNKVWFRALLLIQAKGGLISYDDAEFQMLSRQPGRMLRALMDVGWLAGPPVTELPRTEPWQLTEAGRELLKKISLGHRPFWYFSRQQGQLLYQVGQGKELVGFDEATVMSLVEFDYLTQDGCLTEAGRQVYADMFAWVSQRGRNGFV